jgi:guanine nucleotide-binding protein G(i) subunit alpha
LVGLVETTFKRADLSISLIDVGGQRSERKKWLHCFDSVDAVVFVVAMSEYDQVLSEDKSVNRMKESLKLFSTICNIKWFRKASMLLFLNKKDVFEEKIMYSPITQCFPEYTGAAGDNYEASQYISKQFACQNKCNRGLYFHFTNAKDTQNINIVFDVVIDTILHSSMSELGFQ